jgi:hypothetical protein
MAKPTVRQRRTPIQPTPPNPTQPPAQFDRLAHLNRYHNATWRQGSWAQLIEFLTKPEPDVAANVIDFAISRILARAAFPNPPEGNAKEVWNGLTDAFEMDACIMREAFEVMKQAWSQEEARNRPPAIGQPTTRRTR